MVYLYHQGSGNSHSSNIEVRLKFSVLWTFLKNFLFTMNKCFPNRADSVHRGYF